MKASKALSLLATALEFYHEKLPKLPLPDEARFNSQNELVDFMTGLAAKGWEYKSVTYQEALRLLQAFISETEAASRVHCSASKEFVHGVNIQNESHESHPTVTPLSDIPSNPETTHEEGA